MTLELLLQLVLISTGLITLGTLACLPLYTWDFHKLRRSTLFTKIMWWLPILGILITTLYGQAYVAIPLALVLSFFALYEFYRNTGMRSTLAQIYIVIFLFALSHLGAWFMTLPAPDSITLLAQICIVSVLSDVCAFFFGNFIGRHKLPSALNGSKSWEGVLGQLVGAGIGGLIVFLTFNPDISPILILLVGVASAAGDLINSAAKRSLGIKDWGNAIPGHGGILDRLSSLSLAIALSYWVIVLSI